MPSELKVHPSFFKEFATKTWVSPTEIVKELIENAFDEDATRVLVTVLADGSIVIEDDAGMDQNGMEKIPSPGFPAQESGINFPQVEKDKNGKVWNRQAVISHFI